MLLPDFQIRLYRSALDDTTLYIVGSPVKGIIGRLVISKLYFPGDSSDSNLKVPRPKSSWMVILICHAGNLWLSNVSSLDSCTKDVSRGLLIFFVCCRSWDFWIHLFGKYRWTVHKMSFILNKIGRYKGEVLALGRLTPKKMLKQYDDITREDDVHVKTSIHSAVLKSDLVGL